MTVRYDPAGARCQGPTNGQPGLRELRRYCMARWGGQDLGIYNCRRIRGGSGMSTHASGRAWDWRAPSRAVLEDMFAFLIAHADALNIQRIHDYQRQRNWDTRQGRWTAGGTGPGAGGPTSHVERNWAGANDLRQVEEIIGRQPAPGPTPSPPSPTPPVITFREDDDMPSFEQPLRPGEAPRDPLRPQIAKVDLVGQYIMCIGGASVHGDTAQNVFGVPCRILDLKERTGGTALFNADEFPGPYGTAGIRVTDVFARAHVIPFT